MQHIVATGRGFRPAGVVIQVGGKKAQPLARLGAAGLEHGPDFGFARELAYRGAYLVSGREELQDAVGGDEAGAAGDEDCGHGVVFG